MFFRRFVSPGCISCVLLLCFQLSLLSKATAAPSTASPAPAVVGFDLIRIDTGAAVRRLVDGDVISVRYQYTIVAVTTGSLIRSVTFNSPRRRVLKSPPYTLTAKITKPLRLVNGKYVVSAFVNNDKAAKFSITINIQQTTLPEQGPLPSEVTPDESAVNGIMQPVPALVAACATTNGAPSVSVQVLPPDDFNGLPYQLKGTVSYPCAAQTKFRTRLLEISNKMLGDSTTSIRTAVMPFESFGPSDGRDLTIFPDRSRCGSKQVYLETCIRRPADNVLLCGTSKIHLLPSEAVPEPLLAFRPPIKLELAPGDTATVTMQITNSTEETDGFTNDENQNVPFLIKPVVSKSNITLSNYEFTAKDTVVATLPPSDRSKGGVSFNLNGASVYLQFAQPSCTLDSATYESRYATQVIVQPSIARLTRQDNKLPEFDTPVYPSTLKGQPVTVRVNARNPGNGQRADGTPTGLHYQWYVRTQKSRNFRVYADPIIGATGPTLPIAEAECSQTCGSRFGINGILEYYVDVCNTFGCRRSAKILPNVRQTSNPDEEPSPFFQMFCKDACFGGQRYCLIDGSVRLCPQ